MKVILSILLTITLTWNCFSEDEFRYIPVKVTQSEDNFEQYVFHGRVIPKEKIKELVEHLISKLGKFEEERIRFSIQVFEKESVRIQSIMFVFDIFRSLIREGDQIVFEVFEDNGDLNQFIWDTKTIDYIKEMNWPLPEN